jgi:hypothetical protein
MAEEALMRQAKALAHRRGHSLEDARQAVSDTEAGRQLGDLANGEHRHEKAKEWQGSVFWGRAEERLMHLYCSEALSRFAAERHYSWLESYMEWLERVMNLGENRIEMRISRSAWFPRDLCFPHS